VTTVVLVLVSVALAVTLGILLFGSRRGVPPRQELQKQLEAQGQAQSLAQAELEKRRKELEEHKGQLAEAREQLKQAKRKLFDQKESEKDSRHLARAREEIERSASLQLEKVRRELGAAQVDIQRLKTELDATRSRRPPAPAAETAPPPEPTPPPAEKAVRKFRELSEADRERMQRLEQQAARERARTVDLEHEVKRFRARSETQHRIYVVTKGELDLLKDKFKALEKRLNRTLLEGDLRRRALADLERKSGIAAGRVELTAEEVAASDRKVEEQVAAEAEKVAAGTAPVEGEEGRAAPAEETPDPAVMATDEAARSAS